MRSFSQQDASELQAMVDAVPSHPSECIAPAQVAAKTGLPVGRVEYLLRRHPRYFVNVGGKNTYSLNGFAAHRGSRAKIADEIEGALRESAQSSRLSALAPFASLAAAAGVVVAFLFDRQQWVAALLVAILPSIAFACIGIGVFAHRRRSG